MILKKRTIPILLLFLAVLACDFLFPNLPQNTEPDAGSNVPRRSGECTDQHFKDAELAAYQALVQAQTDAANARNDAISRVQTAYNQNIAQRNDEYQTALKTCTTADCRQAAEKKYDTEVGSQQMHQRDGIEAARVNESTAIKAAQETYNAAVEEARQKYCTKAYTAKGNGNGVEISGLICNLELPFNLGASTSFVSYNVEFIPSSLTAGSFSYHWSQGAVINATASGTYTVTGLETDSPRISVTGDASGVIQPGTADAGLEAVVIVLTPITTDDCKQP